MTPRALVVLGVASLTRGGLLPAAAAAASSSGAGASAAANATTRLLLAGLSNVGATLASIQLINATTTTTAAAAASRTPLVLPLLGDSSDAGETDACLRQIAANTSTNTSTSSEAEDAHLYVRLSTFWYCFLAFVTTLGLVVSLVSNMIIIYLFTGTPSLRGNPSNIIAVNLSLSDLLYCIQWPSVIYCSLSQSTWLLEIDYVCQTFGFITLVTASASILTVLAMSVERALVIRYSLRAKSCFALRHAWLVLAAIWAISVAVSLPPLFGTFNKYTLDPSKTSCTLDYLSSKSKYKLYVLVLYCAYWLLPTTIISICYALILRTFATSSRSLSRATRRTSTSAHQQQRQQQQQRLARQTRLSSCEFVSFELGRRPAATNGASGTTTTSEQSSATTQGSEAVQQNNSRQGGLSRSSLSLRSMAAGTTRRSGGLSRARQLRDSIRLHNFMGGTLGALAANPGRGALDGPEGTPKQRLDGAHQQQQRARGGRLEMRASRQVSTDCEGEDDESEESTTRAEEGPHPRTSFARAPLGRGVSLASSSTTSGGGGAQDDPPPAHQAPDSIAGPRPPLSKSASWCWQKFAANFQANSRRTSLGFDERPGGRSCMQEQLRAGATRARVAASSESPTSSQHSSVALAGGAHASARAAHSARRLRSVSCHYGGSSAHLSRTTMQIRLAKMSFYLILLWLVSWTPIASLGMINSVVKCHHRASALAVFLANTMTKLGPAFDVLIYGVSHPRIKGRFTQIIRRLLMLGAGGGASNAANSKGGPEAAAESNKQAWSQRNNASIRSKCSRPNASLAIY